jgi:cell division protein FtsW
LLFFFLAYSLFRIAKLHPNHYTRILAVGIMFWFIGQALINLLMVLRLFPVIGVPLPFISSGGSSLIANICAFSLIRSAIRSDDLVNNYILSVKHLFKPKK